MTDILPTVGTVVIGCEDVDRLVDPEGNEFCVAEAE